MNKNIITIKRKENWVCESNILQLNQIKSEVWSVLFSAFFFLRDINGDTFIYKSRDWDNDK